MNMPCQHGRKPPNQAWICSEVRRGQSFRRMQQDNSHIDTRPSGPMHLVTSGSVTATIDVTGA